MTERKAVIILEGNSRKTERAVHELQKFVDEANEEPEIWATLQTKRLERTETDIDVESGFNDD